VQGAIFCLFDVLGFDAVCVVTHLSILTQLTYQTVHIGLKTGALGVEFA
jgi:hypothetical protein